MASIVSFSGGVGLLYGGGSTPELVKSGRASSRVVVRAELGGSGSNVNLSVRKEESQVTDTVLVADLAKPNTAYCRCWRSKTFPLCDGSHVKHNKETGDNVGPLLLKK
ncbi:CDGSH iron-sulfur domain-containing protein NEET-like [Impatiens glandulifera]|uniref:CDGSH iron-sulfur domain-containing protein NEET-like n=1 Tax=Impatiens glandulifera TaxID=253017 RepID=UPI001FB152FB|nr:CDGSH iron-sulfur domain-containing protein NEET-like [Impatiens glandulifera]